ncbi:phosphatase PAP2 family protein [Candidatus Uabimicrobium amorphum]|uniref:Phosphoesterase n=1 Tax=Uabimicrobium amorphum TaxID=2596890 RepID=A0A5S9IS80_UABAM|nr:phosphatase PAP2 family protein [Candidatus Uabimicrobium amorphum]BBM87193.1 phosphoesterase [Candidatus Uabimicrobium amorphum]
MNKKVSIVCGILLCLYILMSTNIDLGLSHFFFDGENFSESPAYVFMRDSAKTTKNFYLVMSIVLFTLSLFLAKWKNYRVAMLIILVAPMFSYHVLHKSIKTTWQRPRPNNVKDFGGKYPFQPFYAMNFQGKGNHNSFPSSHCAKGFEYISLCFVGVVYRHTLMFYTGVFLTIVFGFFQMMASVAVGRHFFSDTLYPPLQILVMCYIFWKIFTYIENYLKDHYGKNSDTVA